MNRASFLRTLLLAPFAGSAVLRAAPAPVAPQMVDGWWTDNPAWVYLRPSSVTVLWGYGSADHSPRSTTVEDPERLAFAGHLPHTVVLCGCTSEAQALRYGRWVLAQERLAEQGRRQA